VRGTLFDPEFGGLSGRYPTDQGLYRLKHVGALNSGLVCLSRCNSGWFCHTGLSVISYAAFKHLQIPESKLTPSRPFSGVGPDPMYPVGTITLPVTFGTEDNFRTENVQFEVAEVNLPFNAIIGRPALYRFMAIAHYGYLVLKMPSPAGVLTVQSDRAAAVVAVEKLHALATGLAPAAGT
jgi:hypothetical protein